MNRQMKMDRRQSLGVAFGAAGSVLASSPRSVFAQAAGGGDWDRWRGPNGDNHALPNASFSGAVTPQRIAWSIEIPGRGHSTPIVVGDRLYLTTADTREGTQAVLAISKQGKGLWRQVIHRGGLPQENHPKNTEASPSMAFDGEGLFASFYNSEAIMLTKLSTDGKVLWQKNVGAYSPQQYKYGYAASPLLYRGSVIINADYDGKAFLAALDRKTGKTIWKVRRPGNTSFSTPAIANLAGRDQLLLSGGDMVSGYDPTNGQTLWRADGATTMATCGTMVWDDSRVFASGGYPEKETVCISADGSGRVVWSNPVKCYEQSMLCVDGYIYAVADSGVAYCWRCTDGRAMWNKRLGGKYSSSPLLVGKTIYVFNESGKGFSFAASPQGFQDLGGSTMADEVFASPVVVDDTMYLRVANDTNRRQESLLAIR